MGGQGMEGNAWAWFSLIRPSNLARISPLNNLHFPGWVDLSKMLHDFFEVVTRFFWSCYLILSKLFHVSCPLPNKTKLNLTKISKLVEAFALKKKLIDESKYSMNWARCAFDNVCNVLRRSITSKTEKRDGKTPFYTLIPTSPPPLIPPILATLIFLIMPHFKNTNVTHFKSRQDSLL